MALSKVWLLTFCGSAKILLSARVASSVADEAALEGEISVAKMVRTIKRLEVILLERWVGCRRAAIVVLVSKWNKAPMEKSMADVC